MAESYAIPFNPQATRIRRPQLPPPRPHSVDHDSSFASTRDQDRNPASLPSSMRSRLHIATKPVHETSFARDSVDSDSLRCDPKVATEVEEAVVAAIVENSSSYNHEVESQEKSLAGELTSKLVPLQSIKSMDLSNKAFTENSMNTASKAVEELASQEYCFESAMRVDSYSMSHEGLLPMDVAKQDHSISTNTESTSDQIRPHVVVSSSDPFPLSWSVPFLHHVFSANLDFPTCESIQMSQQVDGKGERTLAVVTKSDKSSEGLLEKVAADDVNISKTYEFDDFPDDKQMHGTAPLVEILNAYAAALPNKILTKEAAFLLEVCNSVHALSIAEINTNDMEVCGKATGSGIGKDFIAGVKMPGLNSSDKADPTQRSQAVRRNVTEGFDPKFVINRDEVNVTQGDRESRSRAAYSQRQRGENTAISKVANVELLMIRGFGPKNLKMLVNREFRGNSQLKQLYCDNYGECSQKTALMTSLPAHDLTSRTSARKVLLDTGVIQTNALTVDHLASLEKYLETVVVSPTLILTTKVEWLKSIKADLVNLDDVPVACRAATDPRIRSITEDFSHCEFLPRLPGYCPMPAFQDAPLVVKTLHKSKLEVRKEFGIGEDVKLFIINFSGQPARWTLKQEWSPDLCLCPVCGASNKQVLPPNFIKLVEDAYTLDLIPASDCLIGKIGYGTFSKALTYKLPIVFVRRDYFNEEPYIRNMLEYYQGDVTMIRRDLLTKHWKPYFERALTLSTFYDGGVNGNEVAARILQDTVKANVHETIVLVEAEKTVVSAQLINKLAEMNRRHKIFDPGGLLTISTPASLTMTRLDGVELF